MEIREPPTKITPLPTRLEVTICVLLDAKNSSRDHQSKHTNISSIWKFVSYIPNFTYMQSIYIHTHIIYIHNFCIKNICYKKNRNNSPIQFSGIRCNSVGRSIIRPSPQWIPSSSVDHPPTRWFHPQQLSTGKDPADVLKTVIPLWLFFLLKGGSDFGGCFLLSCS